MNEFSGIGKMMVTIGLVIATIGLILWVGGKIPGLGRLPGDILIKRGNFTFYFPLATSIVLSLILTLVLAFFRKK